MISRIQKAIHVNYSFRNINISSFLRFCATMFVFLLHGRTYISNIESASTALQWITMLPAWAGVWIFVFLSGYGIGMGFFKNKYVFLNTERHINWKQLIPFYIRRFLKLAPLYYLYCIVYEFVSGNYYFWNDHHNLIKMLTFRFNGAGGHAYMGHLWYVSTAMQLYLIIPFLCLLLRYLKTIQMNTLGLLLVSLLGLFTRISLTHAALDWYTYIYTSFLPNLDLIICGVITAHIVCMVENTSCQTRWPKSISLLLFFLLVGYNCYIYYLNLSVCLYIYRIILPSIYITVCALLVISWQQCNISKNAFTLSNICTPLAIFFDWFAKYSYGFYVFHILILHYLADTLAQTAFYIQASPYVQYITFFGLGFAITLFFSCSFTQIVSLKTRGV